MTIRFLVDSYDEWFRERTALSEDETTRSSEWHDSDDAAFDLLHQMAVELRKRSPDYWTVEEVAQAMRVSKMTVYRLCASGDLPAVRFGRSFRIAEADFSAYLQKNETGRS